MINYLMGGGRQPNGDWQMFGYSTNFTRVSANVPGTLRAFARCFDQETGEHVPTGDTDVTFVFETTTPAASPAVPFD